MRRVLCLALLLLAPSATLLPTAAACTPGYDRKIADVPVIEPTGLPYWGSSSQVPYYQGVDHTYGVYFYNYEVAPGTCVGGVAAREDRAYAWTCSTGATYEDDPGTGPYRLPTAGTYFRDGDLYTGGVVVDARVQRHNAEYAGECGASATVVLVPLGTWEECLTCAA